jgi:hypothetical protein
MNIQIKQFIEEMSKIPVVRDLPHVSILATPDEIECIADYVERQMRPSRGILGRISARAAVTKLNDGLTVAKVDFDGTDDPDELVAEIRARVWMTIEQREGDR